jgi:hypothetical protein
MALQVNITNINSVTYPVDVYVCIDCPDINCTLVDTINSVPTTITIPGPYSGYSSFGVKIIDEANCEYCQTFQGTTTTSTSTTSTTTINPLCVSCDIGFDFYDTNPIAEISVGLITASCDPSVTDYVIDWYGPGIGSTTVAFTSGYGTDYTGDYLYAHPLTGSSAVPVVAGVYTPIIQKIKINGTEYTDLNCFNSSTVDVDALTCDNGPGSTSPYYSHGISFTATTSITPQPVTTTFVLDPLKPYFAYSFKGEQIYDDLKITFFGGNYSDPIVLEYISMGQNVPFTNFSLSLNPKNVRSGTQNVTFPKVLCLTALTVNVGDYLEIEVTPNPINNNTKWELLCECLETFDCELCYDTNYTIPYKIIESTINKTSVGCDGYKYPFKLSACSDSNIYRYLNPGGPSNYIGEINYNGSINGFIYDPTNEIDYDLPKVQALYYNPVTECGIGGFLPYSKICDTPSISTITYNKSVIFGEGLITMTFDTYSDLDDYYTNWDFFYTNYAGNPLNPLDIDYYRWFVLTIPLASGAQQCGDLTGYQTYIIHPSSVVTTGGTGPWTMTVTMPTISNALTWGSCDIGCTGNTMTIVDTINQASTGITNNISIISNTGSKLEYPFNSYYTLQDNTYVKTGATKYAEFIIPEYVNTTIPYSGSPLTLIPSLSGQTCDLSSWDYNSPNPTRNYGNFSRGVYYYDFRIVSLSGDFEIWTFDIANNPTITPPFFKIYENIGGVPNVIDPSYFI